MNKVEQLVKKLSGNEGKVNIKMPEICIVRAINKNNDTSIYIDVEKINITGFDENNPNSNNYYYNVRLTVDQLDNQINKISYNVPNVGSRVLVIWTEDRVAIAITFNKIQESIYNYKSDVNVNSSGKYVFNGGNNKGLVKVDELVQRLNRLEEYLQNLTTVFLTWTPVNVQEPDAANFKTLWSGFYQQQLIKPPPTTNVSDLENPDVKH